MSREFYRRDYDRHRPSRRDSDEDVRQDRSRGTSNCRSDSRPSVSRRTTAEWQIMPSTKASLQSEPSTDPRIRNNSITTGFGEETAHSSILPTPSTTTKAANVTASPVALDETDDTVDNVRAQLGDGGPLDISTKAAEGVMSPVQLIASLLSSFFKEANSAAYSQLREDEAMERRAKAEKIDRQNRRIASAHGDFAAYTEQGEENMKRAVNSFNEAKTRKEEAEKRSSAAAIAAATHILELANVSNVAHAVQVSREQEAKQISPLVSELSNTTQELSGVKHELEQTKATLITVSQELSEMKKELQQTKAGAQITSKKVDTWTGSQKRDLNSVSSEVAEVRLQHNDLRSDIDQVRHECRPIIEDLNVFSSEMAELRRHNERFNGLKGELGNLRKESKATLENLTILQQEVSDFEKRHKESNATVQDLETLQLAVSNNEKKRQESNATVQDLKSLQAVADELSSKLSEMVKRDDFLRLSTMVDSLTEQQKIAIADRFRSIEISNAQFQTHISEQVAAAHPPGQQDMSEVLQALSRSQKEVALLKTGLRTAIDGHKANTHTIRALDQRCSNITTEDMVHAMVRQLERLYPHASQHQANFDTILKTLDTVSLQCHDSHRALEDRVNAAFAKVTKDVKGLTAEAKKVDVEYREHWKRVIEDVKSQRDALKNEVTLDIKTLEDRHAAHLASLQARIDNWKATPAVNMTDIAHDDTSDSDPPFSRIPAARNPFATDTNGVGHDRKRKRVVRLDSPDLVALEEREGSAPLRAKVQRKG